MVLASLLCVASFGQLEVDADRISQAHAGKRIVVDGVYSSVLGRGERRQLRLKRCKAKFLPGAAELGRNPGNLSIVGDVRVENREILVTVVSLRPLPPDSKRFARMADAISDANGWYRLAGWARRRAELYQSAGMAEKSNDAYLSGVALERRAAAGDPKALANLLRTIRRDGRVPSFDFTDLDHEVLRAELAAKRDAGPDALQRFAVEVRNHYSLPPVEQLEPLDPSLRARYDKDPLGAFASASGEQRAALARYLEVEVLRAVCRKRFEGPTPDLLAAAKFAETEMPDFKDIADDFYDRWIDEQSATLGTLGKQQVLTLADRIGRRAGDAGAAGKVLIRWLDQREDQFRDAEKRGRQPNPRDRNELARYYEQLEESLPEGYAHENMVRLTKEAYEIDPTSRIVEARLSELGLRKNADAEWVPISATRTTRTVAIGQRPEQVLQVLGEPDSKAKLVSAGAVTHQWVYRSGKANTYVLFVESPPERPTVAAIHSSER